MNGFTTGHALIVGVGQYQDTARNLPTAAADAQGAAAALANPDIGGYAPGRVQVLLDAQATRSALEGALKQIAQSAQSGETVLLYFSGHGLPGDDGIYHFATHEAVFTPDNQIEANTGLSSRDFVALLRSIKAQKLLCIINACLSERLSPAFSAAHADAVPGAPPLPLRSDILSSGAGRILMTASRDTQPSFYIPALIYSTFGRALIDGLHGQGISNQSGYIGVYELYQHIYTLVTHASKGYPFPQEPVLTVVQGVGPFPIARYPGPMPKKPGAIQQTPPEGMAVEHLKPTAARPPRADQAPTVYNQGRSVINLGGAQISGNVQTGDIAERDIIKFGTSTRAADRAAPDLQADITAALNKGNVTIGDVAGGNIAKLKLNIYPGDPPEVRQQKLAQARQIIADEVLANSMSLDARLGYLQEALAPVADPLEALRQQIAPASSEAAAAGYRQLIVKQQIAALRQALNSRPLRLEFGPSLIQVLKESGVDPDPIRFFYDQLLAVQDATESLLSIMHDSWSTGTAQQRAFVERRIALAVESLHNYTALAHVAGLRVLNKLPLDPATPQPQLSMLRHLEPRQLLDDATALRLLAALADAREDLNRRKQALIAEAEQLLQNDTALYEQLEELVTIAPTDAWNIVVAKAVSLRQLGRVGDAVAAFARYGTMFAATDPTAERYARLAQQFTIQMRNLGVNGAVYIFDVAGTSIAHHAGLAEGDIVIEYNRRIITNVPDMATALSEPLAGMPVTITWLRIDQRGQFQRHSAVVPAGPLGASFMPI